MELAHLGNRTIDQERAKAAVGEFLNGTSEAISDVSMANFMRSDPIASPGKFRDDRRHQIKLATFVNL